MGDLMCSKLRDRFDVEGILQYIWCALCGTDDGPLRSSRRCRHSMRHVSASIPQHSFSNAARPQCHSHLFNLNVTRQEHAASVHWAIRQAVSVALNTSAPLSPPDYHPLLGTEDFLRPAGSVWVWDNLPESGRFVTSLANCCPRRRVRPFRESLDEALQSWPGLATVSHEHQQREDVLPRSLVSISLLEHYPQGVMRRTAKRSACA
jgi:hypothetical protein